MSNRLLGFKLDFKLIIYASGAYYAGGKDLILLTSQVSNCFDINLMAVSTNVK